MSDPITGPVPRDVFRSLTDAPAGLARKTIRKYDPLWGLAPNQEIEWRVTATKRTEMEGHTYVKANTLEEAQKRADKLRDNDFSWHPSGYDDDLDIMTVEPRS